jgi:hypothetical protein
MHGKRQRKSFQEILVEVLDQRIPAENLPNRKRVTVREALIRKLLELAESGHPPAVALVVEFYTHFDVLADREQERRAEQEASNKALEEARKRWCGR